jgi:hypothetical protein
MSCETQLAQARAALHALMTGKQKVSVQYEGRKVQYSEVNKQELVAYIKTLEQQCGTSSTALRGEPFGVTW